VTAAVDQQYGEFVDLALSTTAHTRSSQVGPLPVHLAGDSEDELEQISEHLRAGTGNTWPPLSVTTVDSTSVPADCIPIELRTTAKETLVARGEKVTAVANGFQESFWMLDRKNGHAVRWLPDRESPPYGEQVSPLSLAIRWWAGVGSKGALIHAGAVAGPQGAILLVGNPGAGKSTSAMSCAYTELDVLGDDQVIIDFDTDGQATAHPVYKLAKLTPRSLELIPHLEQHVAFEGQYGKFLVNLPERAPGTHHVRAICLVEQDQAGPTRIESCPRAEVLKAVGVSTLFQLAVAKQQTWEATSKLVRSAPCHRLVVRHPAEVPDVLTDLLRTLGSVTQ